MTERGTCAREGTAARLAGEDDVKNPQQKHYRRRPLLPRPSHAPTRNLELGLDGRAPAKPILAAIPGKPLDPLAPLLLELHASAVQFSPSVLDRGSVPKLSFPCSAGHLLAHPSRVSTSVELVHVALACLATRCDLEAHVSAEELRASPFSALSWTVYAPGGTNSGRASRTRWRHRPRRRGTQSRRTGESFPCRLLCRPT